MVASLVAGIAIILTLVSIWAIRRHPSRAEPHVSRGAILDHDGIPLAGVRTDWQAKLNLRALRELPTEQANEFLVQFGRRLELGVDVVR